MKLTLKIIFIASLTSLLFSCKKGEKLDEARILYAEFDGHYLYKDEIDAVIPKGTSSSDSAIIVSEYIKNWATDILIYTYAKKNIQDREEIRDMVNKYRKTLIINQYKENLIEEKLVEKPTDEEMMAFYKDNSDLFILGNTYMKGLYIKLPLHSPKIDNLKFWLLHFDDKAIEKIEKYCLINATDYEYFGNEWIDFSNIEKQMPSITSELRPKKLIEIQDSTHQYFLKIFDVKLIGEEMPFEIAKPNIYVLLMNNIKERFFKNFELQLYNTALKNNDLKFYKDSIK